METLTIALAITVALTLGAMSPGPSFIVVARMALAASRASGLAAALGMGVGGLVFSILVLFGLAALLAAIPVLYLALKVVGGLYLIYLGFRLWRGARLPLQVSGLTQSGPRSVMRSFWIGLATQVSNPKTAVVYASVFTAFLPDEHPAALIITLPIIVFMIETGWYALVVVVLSAPAPRARYLGVKAWIDRAAGAAMSALGIKLVAEAVPTG